LQSPVDAAWQDEASAADGGANLQSPQEGGRL
jgi:hypothetical protein